MKYIDRSVWFCVLAPETDAGHRCAVAGGTARAGGSRTSPCPGPRGVLGRRVTAPVPTAGHKQTQAVSSVAPLLHHLEQMEVMLADFRASSTPLSFNTTTANLAGGYCCLGLASHPGKFPLQHLRVSFCKQSNRPLAVARLLLPGCCSCSMANLPCATLRCRY